MPLYLLGILVVGGIGGLVLLMHVLGHSRPLRFRDAKAALDHWHRNLPEYPARTATVSPDEKAALIDAGMGLVWAMGADSVARLTQGATVEVTGTGLSIRFPDFAAPILRLPLPAETARDWASAIKANAIKVDR